MGTDIQPSCIADVATLGEKEKKEKKFIYIHPSTTYSVVILNSGSSAVSAAFIPTKEATRGPEISGIRFKSSSSCFTNQRANTVPPGLVYSLPLSSNFLLPQ
jgi:hypothetical protein